MTTQVPALIQTSARDFGQVTRRYLTGWRGLILLAIVALAAGLVLSWSWLVAAGIAPLLISMLPCVAMCALGLCMNRRGGRSCSAEDTSSKTIDTAAETAPPPRILEIQPGSPMGPTAILSATDGQANNAKQRRMTHA
jgi:hypothetical protein